MTKIFHNPKCSKSRETLALLRERGVEPAVVEYLQTPPSRTELAQVLAALGMKPRELMRRKEAAYAELGLDDPKWTDDELIGFMVENPVLIERPIVVTEKGVRIGRPPESVLEILG